MNLLVVGYGEDVYVFYCVVLEVVCGDWFKVVFVVLLIVVGMVGSK